MFKKEELSDIDYWRPISLLFHLYNLFTIIITNQLTTKLDLYQLIEQVARHKCFSTIGHLQKIIALIEMSLKYNIQIHFACIGFQKRSTISRSDLSLHL